MNIPTTENLEQDIIPTVSSTATYLRKANKSVAEYLLQHATLSNMCNGYSARSSQGGTIVILKPTSMTGSPAIRRVPSLRLAQDSETGKTMATIDDLNLNDGNNQVIIQ
jgi:hypothetical protein